MVPAICRSTVPGWLRAGTEASKPSAYGCSGAAMTASDGPRSTMRPRVHHGDLVGQPGHDRQVVGDPQHGGAILGADALHLRQDLRLDGHVQRRGRLVGDDDIRLVEQGGRDGDALAHAAGELVRVGVEPLLRMGDAHAPQRVAGQGAGGGGADGTVRLHRLHHLGPHTQDVVQAGQSGLA